jgi:uncharacterized protein
LFNFHVIAIVLLTFLIAGVVKGLIGLGMPTVSLALLTASVGLPHAMALLLVPSFVTNVWQAVAGRNTRLILARLWLFLVMAAASVWIGAAILARVNVTLLSALLGTLLLIYAVLNLGGVRVLVSRDRETWLSPLAGLLNGVLTGMIGSFIVPGVLFLQALGFARDELIQAMAMLFTVSTVALTLALGSNGLLSPELGVLSSIAVIPAVIGMLIGQWLGERMPDAMFRRAFFIGLLILGAYIVAQTIV